MNGTITLDITQDRQVICNARRNEPYSHRRAIYKLSQFGDVLAFVSGAAEDINDPGAKWEANNE